MKWTYPYIDVRSGDIVLMDMGKSGEREVKLSIVTPAEFTYEGCPWYGEMAWQLRGTIIKIIEKGPNW